VTSSRGQHTADDGSFPRSAGSALARGIALIVAAVVLGLVLLNATEKGPVLQATADDGESVVTTTTEPESTTTTEPARAHDPAEVTILVANGSGVKGAAGRIAESLKASNYVLKESTNAESPAEASIVYFADGYQADARAVASLLTPPPGIEPMPETVPVKDLAGANLLVVVAADLAAGR
jgi:hypothetical protein